MSILVIKYNHITQHPGNIKSLYSECEILWNIKETCSVTKAARDFSLLQKPRAVLIPTQSHIQEVPLAKRPGCRADHSPPSKEYSPRVLPLRRALLSTGRILPSFWVIFVQNNTNILIAHLVKPAYTPRGIQLLNVLFVTTSNFQAHSTKITKRDY
jgi:hypothetical protein